MRSSIVGFLHPIRNYPHIVRGHNNIGWLGHIIEVYSRGKLDNMSSAIPTRHPIPRYVKG
jgi:hypothetical protein